MAHIEEEPQQLRVTLEADSAQLVRSMNAATPLAERGIIDGSIASSLVRDLKNRFGQTIARQASESAIVTVRDALRNPSLDESVLATINEIHYQHRSGNVVADFVATSVRELGFYHQTRALVAQAARHIGLPIEPLVGVTKELYDTPETDSSVQDNKNNAVLLLEVIAQQQMDLDDTPEKVDRIVAIADVAMSLLATEVPSWAGIDGRYEILTPILSKSAASIKDPELKTQAIARLRLSPHAAHGLEHFTGELDR